MLGDNFYLTKIAKALNSFGISLAFFGTRGKCYATKATIRHLTAIIVLCAHKAPFLDIMGVRYQIVRLSTNPALEDSRLRFEVRSSNG